MTNNKNIVVYDKYHELKVNHKSLLPENIINNYNIWKVKLNIVERRVNIK